MLASKVVNVVLARFTG
uniref:Uncharacterized protein n=1 Tax=Anguilla anguilla TaxID=7936 RepID=A0A0E9U2A7_ANGAN